MTDKFIEKARLVHGDKYDYSKIKYIGCYDKVIIICKKHGDFLQQPSSHIAGNGCKKCGNESTKLKQSGNTEEFIEKAILKHGDIYDYSKVNYINQATKVIICCKIHGDFEQTPSNHTNRGRPRGCKKCSTIITANKQRSNKDVFIKRSNKVHNSLYDYSNVIYVNCEIKIKINCKKHGEFIQRPQHHLHGNGCPKCNTRGFSKLQISWLSFISIY